MAAMSKDKDKSGGKDSGKERTNKQKKAEKVLRQAEAEHREEKVGERPPFWVVGAGGSPG